MPNINITVAQKIATNTTPGEVIVCGNSDYTVTFDFDSEWDAHAERTARFVYYKDGLSLYQDVKFTGNKVAVPVLANISYVLVGVYAGSLHTTTPAKVLCDRSILCGDPLEVLTPEEKAKLQAQIGDLAELETEDKSSLVAAINEAAKSGGTVKTVNGIAPDASGNVEIETGGASVEPAEDDIPKVFFGGTLQQGKSEKTVPFRYISKTEDISGYAVIKAQGNSSLSYPKKNQTVKMYKDAACTEKLKVNFKDWGKQNKHCYKANWIDLTHSRNVVSARIWGDIVKSRANYAELPEELRTSPNHGAVDGFPIKVYAAGIYQGRYSLNIPKDAWMANMDDDLDTHCILCSEGYVSGCFQEASVAQWTDEVHDTMPNAIKTRWIEVINFVMNSTDAEFKANLDNYIDVQSLADYHLYGLASCGLDAYGKNQLYMTFNGQKWYASMYDMDSTWGLYWNGSSILSSDYPRTSYEDWKNAGGNTLYVRLENLFPVELYNRWQELKNGPLSIENIFNRFERFTDIAPAELVKEDYAPTTGDGTFTNIPSQETSNIQQIRAFALARRAWTDEYVTALLPDGVVPCTGLSLSATELTFTAEGTQTLTATVTPANTTDTVVWKSSNTNVVTVSNGNVTAVGNGNATITVTCGGCSTTCSVSVSGLVEPVPCTGITLSATELTLAAGESQTLIATVEPSDTTDVVAWNSSAPSIVSVTGGKVTAIASGEAVITATCGNMTASCNVVADPEVNYLDNLAITYGQEYSGSDGTLKTNVANVAITEKFTLEPGCYDLSAGDIWVWDENDNYVGVIYRAIRFTALKGYKYSAHWYPVEEGADLSGKTLTKFVPNETPTISIDLASLTWGGTGSDSETDISSIVPNISEITARASHTILLKRASSSCNRKGTALMFYIYGTATLIVCGMNAATATAYFAENPTTLVING